VAEHCLGLMLDVAHNITRQDRAIRSGEWASRQGFELGGLTLGLIGLGGIGMELARIATGIGMTALSWSRSNEPERAAAVGAKAVTLDELLVRSDVVSLHMTLGPETTHFVGRDFLARMKPGSILINSARGGLVDPTALVDALNSGRLAGAGLDVFHTEPLPVDDALRGLRNVVMTPVSAWNTSNAADRMIGISIENVVKFLSGAPQNVCNPTDQPWKS
jgi:D-3-phosphoglycerate dehydrogenase